ncbi:hypothetical protein ASPBRDRAFT_190712 [Aspergillus brasiliensis CBS 101740]|uniref:Uncharacterized protein n=1 Tax=Aspergillus brasiliensis (strain CBS 101740 / IMI 381727 / IBT 21946) TaxID=767769 RepID=A0A1L9V0C7_ASPBC|nr:hypothetical protein ASPBRDRAFT_190712 [Aspergillus brasiliensis CBS 101740]
MLGVDHDRQQNSNGPQNRVTYSGGSPRGPSTAWRVATSPSSLVNSQFCPPQPPPISPRVASPPVSATTIIDGRIIDHPHRQGTRTMTILHGMNRDEPNVGHAASVGAAGSRRCQGHFGRNGGHTRPGGDLHVEDMRHGHNGQSCGRLLHQRARQMSERARLFGLGMEVTGSRGRWSGPG